MNVLWHTEWKCCNLHHVLCGNNLESDKTSSGLRGIRKKGSFPDTLSEIVILIFHILMLNICAASCKTMN